MSHPHTPAAGAGGDPMSIAPARRADTRPPVSGDDLAVLGDQTDNATSYRFLAPGVLMEGPAQVSVRGDWWHAEQEVDGVTYAVDGEDELGVILALIAKRHGLAAVFAPGDDRPAEPFSERNDPVFAMIFNAVSAGVARTGRFLSLSDRQSIAGQVYQGLRLAGVIA